MLIATEAVFKQESKTDNDKKYGVSTPVTGSVVIKVISPIINIRLTNIPLQRGTNDIFQFELQVYNDTGNSLSVIHLSACVNIVQSTIYMFHFKVPVV